MKRLPQLKPFFAHIGMMMLWSKDSYFYRRFERGELAYQWLNGKFYMEKEVKK